MSIEQQPTLEVDKVNYCNGGRHLLKDLSIVVDPASFTTLMGANGAGKSLFLQLCSGLLTVSSGSLYWRPNSTCKLTPRQTMVFQKPVMLRRSVLENIRYALPGLPKNERTLRAEEALEWAQITQLSYRNAICLSSGQQQQLAIARAWALQPDVLLLDEPTANLDPAAAERVEGLIDSMHKNGVKILMATHNLAQAQRLGGDVIFIHDGYINAYQKTEDFFRSPATEEATYLINREVLLN